MKLVRQHLFEDLKSSRLSIMKKIILCFICFICYDCHAQQRITLYDSLIPNSRQMVDEEYDLANEQVDTLTYAVSVPSLTVFLPPKDKGNGTAVIICPGGGYHVLLSKREGTDIAKAFNKLGVTAFVLKYRLPDDRVLINKKIGPLQDAQQAIKVVRENAKQWGINPQRIGVMGFSAGGHLATTAGTHYDSTYIENKNGISLRPDFMLLINPVISFTDSIGHIGSRNNLLGEFPSQEDVQYFSNEFRVSESTPPAFLVHSGADEVVAVENSMEFYKALKINNVTAGLHIYAKGEHGFLTWPPFTEWFGRCIKWMEGLSLID